MKARSKELLDRSIAAMVAAIDVYNKPDFPYRAESFTILALNSWELLLKAKWLADHDNRMRKHAGRFSRFAMAHQEAQEPSPRFLTGWSGFFCSRKVKEGLIVKRKYIGDKEMVTIGYI